MDIVYTKTLSDWSEIHDLEIHGLAERGWLYRGQRSTGDLKTSLERFTNREDLSAEPYDIESRLLREFQRAYQHYSLHIPPEGALIEWLSLMQHHGCPTRLLDFSYSIYVAAYFALERAEVDCAVWAINGKWAMDTSIDLLKAAGRSASAADGIRRDFNNEHDEEVVARLFRPEASERPVQLACPTNAFRLNERLRIQKGVFLVPGDIGHSFMANLIALPGHDSPDNVKKIVLPIGERRRALKDLYYMNISRTSLFPSLDGYAESLGVFHPKIVEPSPYR